MRQEMATILELSPPEIAVIRSWCEYASDDSFHYGGSKLLLPTEQMLLRKLESHASGTIMLTPSEITCVAGWMERSVEHKFGSATYLFGLKQEVYEKIKAVTELM